MSMLMFGKVQPIRLVEKITYYKISNNDNDTCNSRTIITYKRIISPMEEHSYEECDDVPSSVFAAFGTDNISHRTGENDMHDNGSKISADGKADHRIMEKIYQIFYHSKTDRREYCE